MYDARASTYIRYPATLSCKLGGIFVSPNHMHAWSTFREVTYVNIEVTRRFLEEQDGGGGGAVWCQSAAATGGDRVFLKPLCAVPALELYQIRRPLREQTNGKLFTGCLASVHYPFSFACFSSPCCR